MVTKRSFNCGWCASKRTQRVVDSDAPEADLPESEAIALNLDPKTDKAKVAAVNHNRVAMATLTMAMTTNKTMGALNEAKDYKDTS